MYTLLLYEVPPWRSRRVSWRRFNRARNRSSSSAVAFLLVDAAAAAAATVGDGMMVFFVEKE